MYLQLDSKSQLKMAYAQLERGGHCLNSTSYEKKNLISINPEIKMHQQWDGAAKTLTHAVDRCCLNHGTRLTTVLD